MKQTPKLPGCCTACDKLCFEVVRRDPMTREPIQMGPPEKWAYRVHLIRMSGRQIALTFCDDCVENIPLRQAWEKETLAQVKGALAGLQRDQTTSLRQQWLVGKAVLDFVTDPALGILTVEPWSNYLG